MRHHPDLNLLLDAIDEEAQPVVSTSDADFARFPGLRWSNPLG